MTLSRNLLLIIGLSLGTSVPAKGDDLAAIKLAARLNPKTCISLCLRAIEEQTEAESVNPRVYYYLAQSYLVSEQPQAAFDAASQGRTLSADANDELLGANLALFESVALNAMRRPADAAEAARQGIQIAKRIPNERLVAKLETELGTNLYGLGETRQALAAFRRALEIADRISAEDIRFAATVNLISATEEYTDSSQALATYRELLQDAEKLQDSTWAATILLNYGRLLIDVGDYSAAEQSVQRAVELAGNCKRSLHPREGLALAGVGRRESGEGPAEDHGMPLHGANPCGIDR